MVITSEQRELLALIMVNKNNLEELLKLDTTELHMKDSITIAGITWSKFAEDEDGNACLLADEPIYIEEFGANNDWRKSPIREKLNDYLYKKIVAELGEDAIVPITVDLFSHDGLRDYGTCEDMVSILTYDLYRNNRENIKNFKEWFWTCTPDSTLAGYGSSNVRCVNLEGDVRCAWIHGVGAVRPFFIWRAERSEA